MPPGELGKLPPGLFGKEIGGDGGGDGLAVAASSRLIVPDRCNWRCALLAADFCGPPLRIASFSALAASSSNAWISSKLSLACSRNAAARSAAASAAAAAAASVGPREAARGGGGGWAIRGAGICFMP